MGGGDEHSEDTVKSTKEPMYASESVQIRTWQAYNIRHANESKVYSFAPLLRPPHFEYFEAVATVTCCSTLQTFSQSDGTGNLAIK